MKTTIRPRNVVLTLTMTREEARELEKTLYDLRNFTSYFVNPPVNDTMHLELKETAEKALQSSGNGTPHDLLRVALSNALDD